MSTFFRFLLTKVFLINLILAMVLVSGTIWGVFRYLDVYTLHNETITVPDFKGFKPSELDGYIEDKKLQ